MTDLYTSRWKFASNAALLVRRELAQTVRMLGKLDATLARQNTSFKKLREDVSSITPEQWEGIHDAIALSHLWVLGAYELVRVLHATLKSVSSTPKAVEDRCGSLKRSFERIRMPLAKLQTPRHHSQSDFGVAYPAFKQELGLVWMVADNAPISRDDLGRDLLEFLEFLRAAQA